MAGQGVGFSELSSSSNGSDNTKRPGIPKITPSDLVHPVNLQKIAQRKAQIKTYPVRRKLEILGVHSFCQVKVTWPHFIVYAHWSGMMEKSFIMPLFSLFPVGSHSPSMVFFSFLLSILKVVDMKIMCEGKTAPQNLQSFVEWRWMCGSRKYPYLPYGRLFDLHPPTPRIFRSMGSLLTLLSSRISTLLPPSLMTLLSSGISHPSYYALKFKMVLVLKKKKWIQTQLRKHGRSYHNSVMEV